VKIQSACSILLAPVLLAAASLAFVARADGAAAATFKRGVNISNWLSQNDAARPYAAPWFTEADVAWIQSQGFDHIRFPIDTRIWFKPDGTLDESKVAPFDQAVAWARRHGLGAILDVHFLEGADFNQDARSDTRLYTDPALLDRAARIWRVLATRYAKEGDYLRFELLNEPKAPENAQLNVFNARMLATIRESNPTRVVYFPVNRWNTIPNIGDLELPAKDPNVAVTVHFYEPLVFTHQRVPWVYPTEIAARTPAVIFPGIVPDLRDSMEKVRAQDPGSGKMLSVENDIAPKFALLAEWARTRGAGREILLGEFGVYELAPGDSAARWIRAVRQACERNGFGWTVWDYCNDFPIRRRDGSPAPALEGLFKD
jgi:endoglucanase